MNFEIRGVGFINKGAELMLRAILHQVQKWGRNHIVAVDLKTGNQSQRSNLDLYTIPWAKYKKVPYSEQIISKLSSLVPKKVLLKNKMIPLSDIQVILDSSGFAYSDQWGTDSIADLLNFAKKRHEFGQKIIFLPQAFGPFDSQTNQANMIAVIEIADLLYARDHVSYQHLIRLVNDPSKIKISPDFTNIIDGIVPDYIDSNHKLAYLVPNARMVDKSETLNQEKYLNFFRTIAQHLIQHGYEISFLVHETNDIKLTEQLQSQIGSPSRLVLEQDPLKIKGLLGRCSVVVGSRYHAIVNSLSQGIPTLGTSWSHKYEALFKDYDCPDCLINNIGEEIEVESKLLTMLVEPDRSQLITRIKKAAEIQKTLSQNMWKDIYQYLFNTN